MDKKINLSLAAYPGAVISAIPALTKKNITDPFFGELSLDTIQLVPQTLTPFKEEVIVFLKENFPNSSFRLHANVYMANTARKIYDLSNWKKNWNHFEKLAYFSKLLSCSGYSAHTGFRANSTLKSSIEGLKALTDLFECEVSMEGQYPTREGDVYVLSNWQEYKSLLTEKVPYVIDFSHLNILKCFSNELDLELVKDLVASEYCAEVHISENNGKGDQHQRCRKPSWWHDCMKSINSNAVIFYEGNLLREI